MTLEHQTSKSAIDRFRPGERLIASRLNQLVDATNDLVVGVRPPAQIFRPGFDQLIRMAVVRDIFDGNSEVVRVREVRDVTGSLNQVEMFGEEYLVNCWPSLYSRHYKPAWSGSEVSPLTRILPVYLVGSVWRIVPMLKVVREELDPDVNFSDCGVTSLSDQQQGNTP